MDVFPSMGIPAKASVAARPGNSAPEARYHAKNEVHLEQRLGEAMERLGEAMSRSSLATSVKSGLPIREYRKILLSSNSKSLCERKVARLRPNLVNSVENRSLNRPVLITGPACDLVR